MKIFEIGTGYTSIPARLGAATEIVVEELTQVMIESHLNVSIVDIQDSNRKKTDLPITEVPVPRFLTAMDTSLNLLHKCKRVIYSISLAFVLKKLISQYSKDEIVLHFHNQYNLFFFLLLISSKMRKRVHIGYTVHSYIWQNDWKPIAKTVRKKYFQEIFCCKRADKVFVLNEKTAIIFIQKLNIPKIRIVNILNGVNTNTYRPFDNSAVAAIKIRLNLHDRIVFFHAGSVCERKNQIEAIKLLLPLMKENPTICFVYAGGIISSEYQQSILSFSKENGIANQVLYVGELAPGKNLNDYYNASRALIFSSKQEALSLVIVEALSAGLPILVNKNSNLALPYMESCLLQYQNESNFLELIKKNILSEERRIELSKKCRSIAETFYSWNAISQDYKNQFQGLCQIMQKKSV